MKTSSTEDRVLEAVRGSNSGDSLIRLSNGIVLEPLRIPNLLFAEIVRKFEQPKVPRIYIEDIGRDEENPNDPRYISDMNAWNANVSLAIVDLMIVVGTQLHSVPKGLHKPEDAGWTRKLLLLGIDPGDDELKRYLMWVKYYAAVDPNDIEAITSGVGRLSGVSEEDVSETVKQFRDNAG